MSVILAGSGALLGATIYNQAISFDCTANRLGLVSSDGGAATLGN